MRATCKSRDMFHRVDAKLRARPHQFRPIADASAAARLGPAANSHALRHTFSLARGSSPEVDLPPESGGVGSERHAAARMPIPSMSARASAGVR